MKPIDLALLLSKGYGESAKRLEQRASDLHESGFKDEANILKMLALQDAARANAFLAEWERFQ